MLHDLWNLLLFFKNIFLIIYFLELTNEIITTFRKKVVLK